MTSSISPSRLSNWSNTPLTSGGLRADFGFSSSGSAGLAGGTGPKAACLGVSAVRAGAGGLRVATCVGGDGFGAGGCTGGAGRGLALSSWTIGMGDAMDMPFLPSSIFVLGSLKGMLFTRAKIIQKTMPIMAANRITSVSSNWSSWLVSPLNSPNLSTFRLHTQYPPVPLYAYENNLQHLQQVTAYTAHYCSAKRQQQSTIYQFLQKPPCRKTGRISSADTVKGVHKSAFHAHGSPNDANPEKGGYCCVEQPVIIAEACQIHLFLHEDAPYPGYQPSIQHQKGPEGNHGHPQMPVDKCQWIKQPCLRCGYGQYAGKDAEPQKKGGPTEG
ncbi:hypothetical protein DBT_2411 [Dissulfuribacter thermophilus]|uniref:Uncharacterized protein n=1 Tax=Dissulfuribacter thermophilus TaxID=1156395 RepID=A0A1B9F2P6_9BACT|nr:hypothetical protein DBT_2411 [Dissulfuribacter thermophilus]